MFENEKWEIIESPRYGGINEDVFLVATVEGKHKIAHFNDNGDVILVDYIEGEEPNPTFRMPAGLWKHLKELLVEDVPKQRDPELLATLEATKYHLEDMRKLVFKIKNR